MGQPDSKRTKQTDTKPGQVEDQERDIQGNSAGDGRPVGRGGRRPGAGRPQAPASAVLRIRLPLPVHAKVLALGGDIWVKRVINEALLKNI